MLTKLSLNNNMLKFCLNCASLKANILEYRKLLFVTDDFMRKNGFSYIMNKFEYWVFF